MQAEQPAVSADRFFFKLTLPMMSKVIAIAVLTLQRPERDPAGA